MNRFKDLEKGRLLYISNLSKMNFDIYYITDITISNGFLHIIGLYDKTFTFNIFIPQNHFNANKLKIGKKMIYLNRFSWEKDAIDRIKRNSIIALRFGINFLE